MSLPAASTGYDSASHRGARPCVEGAGARRNAAKGAEDMHASLNDKMDKVLDKTDVEDLKSDMAEVKTALKAKGII
jgi:hypothetical protein